MGGASQPKTLQDAVHATEEVRVRYLWIFALCLVQDDPVEWAQGASQMSRIYQDWYYTIAAMGAKISAGGLFVPRVDNAKNVTLPYMGCHSKYAQCHFYLCFAQHKTFNRVQQSLWNSGGWVLQERVLGGRIVLFAEGQTFFECQHHSKGEDRRDMRLYGQKQFGKKLLPPGEDWE